MNFLEFGGILFWILVLASVIAIAVALEDDKGEGRNGWPTLWLAIAAVTFYVLYPTNLRPIWDSFHLWPFLSYLGIYVAIGIFWSFFKWGQFAKRSFKKYQEDLAYHMKHSPSSTPPIQEDYRPYASKNKAQLTSWILWWPFSILRYILGNLVRDFFNLLITKLGGAYDRITLSFFK